MHHNLLLSIQPVIHLEQIMASPWQRLSFTLDFVLVIAALGAYLARPRIGGELAKGLETLMIGIVVLGLAHLTETVLFIVLDVDIALNEIIQRLLVAAGFFFVIWGFLRMRKAFDE